MIGKNIKKVHYTNSRWKYKSEKIFKINKYLFSKAFKIGVFNKKLKRICENFNVENILIGHFHFELEKNIPGYGKIQIFSAYAKNGKIYNFYDGFLVADIHLGSMKYKKEELTEIEKILKKREKLYILGDLTEKYVPEKKYNKHEKNILNQIIMGVKNGNVIRIKGNHDDPKYSPYMQNYYIIDKTILIHGDIIFNLPFALSIHSLKNLDKINSSK